MEHSFCKQFLKREGYKLFISEEQILNKNIPAFNIPEFKTKIAINCDLSETSDNVVELSYSDLNSMGFMIVSEKVFDSERWRYKQGVKYRITRINQYLTDYNQIPQNHLIEYDTINKKIRLCGSNAGEMGIGKWIHLTRNKPSKLKLETSSDIRNYCSSILNPLKAVHKEEFIEIPEIPLLITDSGELVCINFKKRNAPVVGCIGARGGGKTMLLHSIADNIFKKDVGYQYHLNDRRDLFLVWSMLQNHKPFIKELELINHQPIRLPIVGLYPNTNNLKEIEYEKEEMSFRISVPFKNFIKDYTYWTQRIKNWEFKGASLNVLRDLMESSKEFENCKTRMDAMKVIQDYLNKGDDKVDKGMKRGDEMVFDAIKRRLDDIFNQKFLDVSSGIPSKWRLTKKKKEKFLIPPTALMLAGLIPVIKTSHLFKKEYYPQMLRWIQESIVEDNDFFDKRVFAFYDEIQDIIKRKKAKSVASESIIEDFTGGRNINRGIVWNTQNYGGLDDDIKTNTTHLFCFGTNTKNELNEIKTSFNLPDKFVNDIKKMKPLRAVAITNRDEFAVYSQNNKKPELVSGDYFVGRIIPSMSYHKTDVVTY